MLITELTESFSFALRVALCSTAWGRCGAILGNFCIGGVFTQEDLAGEKTHLVVSVAFNE